MTNKFNWKEFIVHFAGILILITFAWLSYTTINGIAINGFNFNKFSVYKEECRNENIIVGNELIEQGVIHHEENIKLKPFDYLGSYEETSKLINPYIYYSWDCSEYQTWQDDNITRSLKIKDIKCSKNYSSEELKLSIYQTLEASYLLPRTYYQILRDKIPYGKDVILVFDEVLFSQKKISGVKQICEKKSVEEDKYLKIIYDDENKEYPAMVSDKEHGYDCRCIENKKICDFNNRTNCLSINECKLYKCEEYFVEKLK